MTVEQAIRRISDERKSGAPPKFWELQDDDIRELMDELSATATYADAPALEPTECVPMQHSEPAQGLGYVMTFMGVDVYRMRSAPRP